MAKREDIIQQIFETTGSMKRRLHGQFQSSFEQLNISPAQMELLFTVYHVEPVTHKQLAHKLQMTPGAVSQLVDGLEEHRLISRAASPTDRRVHYISVSRTGKRKMEELKKFRQQIFTRAFDSLSDKELEDYLQVQRKLVNYFENDTKKETA